MGRVQLCFALGAMGKDGDMLKDGDIHSSGRRRVRQDKDRDGDFRKGKESEIIVIVTLHPALTNAHSHFNIHLKEKSHESSSLIYPIQFPKLQTQNKNRNRSIPSRSIPSRRNSNRKKKLVSRFSFNRRLAL